MHSIYLKHSESQRVSEPVFVDDDRVSPTALHVDTGEGVQLGVNPVKPLVQQVCGGLGGWRDGERVQQGKTSVNHIVPMSIIATRSLPSVIPLGQTMLSVTRLLRSPPFRPALSIFAGFPQSVQ